MPERVTDPELIQGYLSDASNTHGHAEALLRPTDVHELSATLRHCQKNNIPVTITAQRTSTTGGPVPHGGWLVSTERLVGEPVVRGDRVTVPAGLILGELQDQLLRQGLLYPPDPTSNHECSVGASIACNASGARSYKYGPTRPWVESVQVVLADGQVVHADRSTPVPEGWQVPRWQEPPVKTAAGLFPADNLLDLMIGQEGILGVITQATLRVVPAPERVFSVVVFFPTTSDALGFVRSLKRGEGVSPRCIEWYDRHSLTLVRERVPEVPGAALAAVWCEQEAGPDTEDALLEAWLELIEGSGALDEHTLFAQDDAGLQRLRAIRHAVPAGVNERVIRNGMPKVGTDFAVPDAALGEMMRAYEAVAMDHVLFGHVGDNHLHLNLLPASPQELEQAWEIWRGLYAQVVALGGTLSAEHGVGKLKRPYLPLLVGADVMQGFARLKRQVDPAWILGRGTMIEAQV